MFLPPGRQQTPIRVDPSRAAMAREPHLIWNFQTSTKKTPRSKGGFAAYFPLWAQRGQLCERRHRISLELSLPPVGVSTTDAFPFESWVHQKAEATGPRKEEKINQKILRLTAVNTIYTPVSFFSAFFCQPCTNPSVQCPLSQFSQLRELALTQCTETPDSKIHANPSHTLPLPKKEISLVDEALFRLRTFPGDAIASRRTWSARGPCRPCRCWWPGTRFRMPCKTSRMQPATSINDYWVGPHY